MVSSGISAMPHTPVDLFSGLAIISATPQTPASAVPSFKIVPPSPEQSEIDEQDRPAPHEEAELHDHDDDFFIPGGINPSPFTVGALPCSPAGSASSWPSPASHSAADGLTPSSARSIGSQRSLIASTVDDTVSDPNHDAQIPDEEDDLQDSENTSRGVRSLTHAEARQLTLIMRASLGAIARTRGLESKEAMQESINLSQRMHDAGLRWDKRRRVMGIHLRGVCEGLEGIAGRSNKGDVAVEYIKGSFVSSFPPPHPLDEFPLDLDLPDTRPSPPTPTIPTLQAGLARAMGVRPLPLILHDDQPAHDPSRGGGQFAPQTGALTAIERSFVMAPLGAAGWEGRKGGMARLRGLKGANMWVRTAAPIKTKHSTHKGKSLKVPLSAASFITPTRMTALLSASSGRKKKASIRFGADFMASIKGFRLNGMSVKTGKMGKMTKLPKMPKVPGGVVRMGQLVVPKKSFAAFNGQRGRGKQGEQGEGGSFETLPGSALPTARRVSVSGWQVR